MYTVTNGPCTRLNSTNAVLKAFLLAYNNHQDLVLSPDDMWFIVCLQYAKYVNDHAEQLRSLFVEHSEGKKVLCVMEPAFLSDENDCTLDDWKQLRIKTGKLKTYCIGDNGKDDFGAYIDGILPIFDQFIET
ncbi:unnamed protein product [Rotaria sordida]|uniref:Uncharacterized protein n=1 Tax=Rotaria sordida TaxID=392033 RepID=A0A816CXW1_9BILA|nr:unnamed protein product [Rotaria sordida]CAF1626044.1 unnamed protein product [Rotaria sordida]